MKVLSCWMSVLLLALGAAGAAAEEPRAAAGELATDDQKTLYAIGMRMGMGLSQLGLSKEELATVEQGLHDGAFGRTAKVDLQAIGPKMMQFSQQRIAATAAVEKEASEAFLAEKAAVEGAVKTDSGLIYKEIEAGTGASPAATDRVTVHYQGTLRNGSIFDSSIARGEPATFGLNQVIRCWTEGLQKMKVGGKSQLICPSSIAYGDNGAPPSIPPGAALVFEVELLEIAEAKPAE